MDVQRAFLNGDLNEEIYIKKPKVLLFEGRKVLLLSFIRHYMVSNKPQGLGTSSLIFFLLLMDSLLVLLTQIYTSNDKMIVL